MTEGVRVRTGGHTATHSGRDWGALRGQIPTRGIFAFRARQEWPYHDLPWVSLRRTSRLEIPQRLLGGAHIAHQVGGRRTRRLHLSLVSRRKPDGRAAEHTFCILSTMYARSSSLSSL